MRLGKTVFAEAQDLLIDLSRERFVVAALAHADDQTLLEMLEPALAFPRRHRAPQLVGLARREAGGDNGELHHLLLENRHAECALEHAFNRVAGVRDGLERLPAA